MLFTLTIFIGWFLTFALFGFKIAPLQNKNLNLKILMWFPISIIFLATLLFGSTWLGLLLAAIILFGLLELINNYYEAKKINLITYQIFFIVGLLHLIPIFRMGQNRIIILLVVTTVFSDVLGFFFGNLFGRHKLPAQLNNNKSWEGVIGQIIGALIGLSTIKLIIPEYSLLLFIPVGIGCAIGDLFNSYVKREIGIKNWSNFIPGHGGFFDRFCSLAGSAVFLYWSITLLR